MDCDPRSWNSSNYQLSLWEPCTKEVNCLRCHFEYNYEYKVDYIQQYKLLAISHYKFTNNYAVNLSAYSKVRLNYSED